MFNCGNNCGNWWWIIILLLLAESNDGCGCGCGCNNNNNWWWIIILILAGFSEMTVAASAYRKITTAAVVAITAANWLI